MDAPRGMDSIKAQSERTGGAVEEITHLSHEDFEYIHSLSGDAPASSGAHGSEGYASLSDIAHVLEKGGAVFVVREGARIVGALIVHKRSGGIAEVRQFGIASSSRGTNVGRELLEAAEAYARREMFRSMVVEAHDDAEAMRALAQAGFSRDEAGEDGNAQFVKAL